MKESRELLSLAGLDSCLPHSARYHKRPKRELFRAAGGCWPASYEVSRFEGGRGSSPTSGVITGRIDKDLLFAPLTSEVALRVQIFRTHHLDYDVVYRCFYDLTERSVIVNDWRGYLDLIDLVCCQACCSYLPGKSGADKAGELKYHDPSSSAVNVHHHHLITSPSSTNPQPSQSPLLYFSPCSTVHYDPFSLVGRATAADLLCLWTVPHNFQ